MPAMMRRPAALALLALLLPGAAAAQPLRARYEVHALGSVLLELEARFELSEAAYRIEAAFRTRGMAALLVPAEHFSRAQGAFTAEAAAPAAFVSEGTWRGNRRRIVLDWTNRDPRVVELVPNDASEDREPVPPPLQRGTVDILSAFAALTRQVDRAGHCDLTAPLFDGRRRSDIATRSAGRERILPWRNAWHGEALRCTYEGRLVAGFRRDQDRARQEEPQRGTAWMAVPYPGAPPIPVRIDIPTRWFGTATAVLLGAEPIQRRAEFGR
ncbi:DUF3108 domain-containing protein [Falsiroseomonas bella]|uniref:DUF3108 domain-containing protein n=2 Tax=Falsiroseomonas bella TaxID=2184016 RepID=A0A317FEH1_9PROT|nr:DUF3108 domain-containing protein [Falsiroseomonas bella]